MTNIHQRKEKNLTHNLIPINTLTNNELNCKLHGCFCIVRLIAINVIKKGTFMDIRTIMLLCTLLITLFPSCRKRTRQQKKIDKIKNR